jgi:outer membrane immunogenic protein
MRKLVCLFWLIAVVTLPMAAQGYLYQLPPKYEVSSRYSGFDSSFAGTRLYFNGGSGSVTVNATPWLGFTGDFGVYHHSDTDLSNNNFTYLFGPQFTYRGNEHVNPFFQVLVGGSHLSTTVSLPGIPSVSNSSNAFAFAAGGGLDVKVSPHIAVRVAQIDYLLTKFQDDLDNRQNNVRISAGIVFRWGGTSSSGIPTRPVSSPQQPPTANDLRSAISTLPEQQAPLKQDLLKNTAGAEKDLGAGNHAAAASQLTAVANTVMSSQLTNQDKAGILSAFIKSWEKLKVKAKNPITRHDDCSCKTVGPPACVPDPGQVCFSSRTACASTARSNLP